MGENVQHVDFVAKHRLQAVVTDDVAAVGGVLEVVQLDVGPNLLDDLGTGHLSGVSQSLSCRADLSMEHA